MTLPRRAQVALSCTPYYHCISRCVRRAFLCGTDAYTGKDFDHRKQWLLERIAQQGAVFAIDVCAYAIMSNHFHLVIRVEPSRAHRWSDEDVIHRWTQLFKGPILVQQWLAGEELSPAQRDTVKEIAGVWRRRLADISWYMRCLNEHIARRANAEDDCTGRFWEGRFKSQALLDEAALLACMAYVDLNPVRAGLATSLAESDFTSVQQRLRPLEREESTKEAQADQDAGQKVPLAQFSSAKTGPSSRGPELPFRLPDYIKLVEQTGRMAVRGKGGVLSEHCEPVLRRLSLTAAQWQLLSINVQSASLSAVGNLGRLRSFCNDTGRSRLPPLGLLKQVYQL